MTQALATRSKRKRRARSAVARDRAFALDVAGRLLRLAGLSPDDAARVLVVASAPRTARDSERGPSPRRGFCAYCLCAADAASALSGRDAEFLELADYFLERLPGMAGRRRGRLDQALRGEG